MRILITGATGFIGKYLIPLLVRHQLLLLGAEEARFFQENISYIKADLAEPETWEKKVEDFAPEACIHLAWKGLPDYSFACCLENFNLSTKLFEFLALKGCKKIFAAGTCWEYGSLRGTVKEDDTSDELSLFASFKTSLRLVGESIARYGKVDFIWGRIFFVYGPGQRETSLIPSCYASFASGKAPAIKNPKAACDFIHVIDVAEAIKSLIEAEGVSGTFNIGSGCATEVASISNYIAQTLKVKDKLFGGGDSSEKEGFWADLSLITSRTSWRPQISLKRGVEETILELRKKNGSS
jgi:nucleoside-diphosphate-sugar epimerase